MKICHLTSVHPRDDARVFHKQCKSLSEQGCELTLVVADGLGDEKNNNIQIYDVGKSHKSRFFRFTKTTNAVYNKAKSLNVDLYHLHDPELIPIGLSLKMLGKKVVFDAHEDYISIMSSKVWIHPLLRGLVSFFFSIFYNIVIKKMDGIVLAADTILLTNSKQLVFRNLTGVELNSSSFLKGRGQNTILYTGGITKYRGIEQVLKALLQSNIQDWKLIIIGREEADLKTKLQKELADDRVQYLGLVRYEEVIELMFSSTIGVVMNQPVFNYDKSLPNKLFEYMAHGLPVVCSNYPHWKKIVEDNKAGVCCDPQELEDISKAIEEILIDAEKQKVMSKNGLNTIKNKYNLTKETKSLIQFYKQVLHEK